jgi:hypothetical protein
MTKAWWGLAAAVGIGAAFAACGSVAGSTGDAADAGSAAPPVQDAGIAADAAVVDPFAELPANDEGLTNVSSSLMAVLENGELSGACARMRANPANRRERLLCGKSMFFDDGFSTVGVPASIFDFMASRFPDELGLGFSKLGMIPDPRSTKSRPLGAPDGAPLNGNATVAFGCASCHFGKLPDGRYAVGAPNHDYDYGGHILNLILAPQSAAPTWSDSAHHPAALAKTAAVRGKLAGDLGLRLQLTGSLLPLLGSLNAVQNLDRVQEGQYAAWRRGTMDFLMAPLPLDDKIHTVSKILSLWNIPTTQQERAAGMPHAMLGWTGGTKSLLLFLKGFVALGEGAAQKYPDEVLMPMIEYLASLRAPKRAPAPPAADVARGEEVFRTIGACLPCHDAPGAQGSRIFTFDEIGTDLAMKYWGDTNKDGQMCCGLGNVGQVLVTHGIKSPRLVGSWALGKFLHNGSIDSLEQLLCLEPRPATREPAYGSQGHTFGCDLGDDDRRALAAYLRAH